MKSWLQAAKGCNYKCSCQAVIVCNRSFEECITLDQIKLSKKENSIKVQSKVDDLGIVQVADDTTIERLPYPVSLLNYTEHFLPLTGSH